MKFSAPLVLFSGLSILAATALSAEKAEIGGHGSGASELKIAPASKDAEIAMKAFKFDPGLKISLWAAEPMLANPVCFSEDEKGHWYVAETFRQERGAEDNRAHPAWQIEDISAQSIEDRLAMMHRAYPNAEAFAQKFTSTPDRIRRLTDTQGVGHADQENVFADGFNEPLDGTGAGILARGNEVWYTCIPSVWRLTDSKGTGTADQREKLSTGFGVHFALRGHDMHGLRFGPDGKLYFSIGDRALRVKNKEGKELVNTDSGSILRCDPDGAHLEIFATGVRNPQELAFDEHGNLFTGDNNSDAGDAARFAYIVEGGDSGWRMAFQYLPDRGPWMTERPWDAKIASTFRNIIPCVGNVGNGPSGLTYNPGTGLSEKYAHKFFLSDFRGGAGSSVVHEISVEPKGAFFTLTHRDWVKGILTTDVEFGNDGALYVLDWVASWGGSGKGRIYRFADPAADAALQRQTERLIAEGPEKKTVAELLTLLGFADQRVRQAAQFALADRAKNPAEQAALVAQLSSLAATAQNAHPLARLHAIWALGQIAATKPDVLKSTIALLGDSDFEVRAQAAKVLGDARFAPAVERLTAALRDKENRVRFFAALALGKIGHPPAFEPLCAMLAENNDQDPIVRHGGIMGLAGCGTAEQIAAKSADPSVAVRGAAVIALRRLVSPLVGKFLADADPGVVLDAARAIHDAPIPEAFPQLAALTGKAGLQNPALLKRAVNAEYRVGGKASAQALCALASAASAPEAVRKDALDALGKWANPSPLDRFLNQYRPLPKRPADDAVAALGAQFPILLKDAPAAVQESAAKTAVLLALASAGEPLHQLAVNPAAAASARVEAIRALASLKDPRISDAAKIAIRDRDPKVRTEALKALAGVDPAAAVKIVEEIINAGSTLEKQGALAALAQIKSREAEKVLASMLDQLAAGKLAGEIQLDLLEASEKHPSGVLQDKVTAYQNSLASGDDLAKYRVALLGGNAESGRKIFREKAAVECLRCHKCEIGDSIVGPELTHIGTQKDRVYLLESIIYPNKKIAAGFEIAVLTLKDGNVVAGRLVGEDPQSLKIESTNSAGKPAVLNVATAQIKQRDRAPSPMPPNFGEVLSKSELRDLVEYLATRK